MLNEGFENSQRLEKCGKSGDFSPNLVTLTMAQMAEHLLRSAA